jgi:hypothetical protein
MSSQMHGPFADMDLAMLDLGRGYIVKVECLLSNSNVLSGADSSILLQISFPCVFLFCYFFQVFATSSSTVFERTPYTQTSICGKGKCALDAPLTG